MHPTDTQVAGQEAVGGEGATWRGEHRKWLDMYPFCFGWANSWHVYVWIRL